MFGADLAYMDSCIDEEYGTESLLPEYLFPTFRVTNPWHRQSNKTQLESDIIVIAEFSELEGPKPVVIILSVRLFPISILCLMAITFNDRIISDLHHGFSVSCCTRHKTMVDLHELFYYYNIFSETKKPFD